MFPDALLRDVYPVHPHIDRIRSVESYQDKGTGELVKVLLEFCQESFGINSLLKANDKIISVPDDDDVAERGTPPPIRPGIQDIVKEDVREERADD